MRFGLTILTDLPWAEAAPRWQAAEQMGFDHAWTYDHLVWGGLPEEPWVGAVPTLAAAAAVTSSIRVGTLVASPNFRHPYAFFRDVQAIESIADGRFLLGLGTGGDVDSGVLGVEKMPLKDRVDRFQEFVGTLRALRDDDHVTSDGPLVLHGRRADAARPGAHPLPGGRQRPALAALRGPGRRRLDHPRTARLGAARGVVRRARPVARDTFEDALVAAGREPADVPRYVVTDSTPHLSSVKRFALESVGVFEEIAGRVAELGFTDLITHWPRADTAFAGEVAVLEAVAADVLPRLQS